jgi:hypothetical protein
MKRDTTKHGAITSHAQLKEEWIKCWKEISQECIQAWIEQIIEHVREVIRLNGGNEYCEGRLKGKAKNRVHELKFSGVVGPSGYRAWAQNFSDQIPCTKNPAKSNRTTGH